MFSEKQQNSASVKKLPSVYSSPSERIRRSYRDRKFPAVIILLGQAVNLMKSGESCSLAWLHLTVAERP